MQEIWLINSDRPRLQVDDFGGVNPNFSPQIISDQYPNCKSVDPYPEHTHKVTTITKYPIQLSNVYHLPRAHIFNVMG